MKIKKITFLFLLILNRLYSMSLKELIDSTLQNNKDIISAQNVYNSILLEEKKYNGSYSPQILISSSTTVPDGYKWDTIPDYFSSSITYNQPVLGGLTLGITTNFAYSTINILDEKLFAQTPNVIFSISQSMYPYWCKGKMKDPVKLYTEQQIIYYYNQLIYTKKNVLLNLIQNYIHSLICKKEMQIYQTSISLVDTEIEAANKMKILGSINQNQITELLNLKWSYQQDLMNSYTLYNNYFHNLQTISNLKFNDISDFENDDLKVFLEIIDSISDNILDPLEDAYKLKIEILETSYIIQEQASAPILSFSIKPSWNSENKKQSEWREVFKDNKRPSNWAISLNCDFSPFFSANGKQYKKKYEIELKEAQNDYKVYLQNKSFVLQQYENLLSNYQANLFELMTLYEEEKKELLDFEIQFNSGEISKVDYDSVKTRIENCKYSLEIVELNIFLYKILISINK